MTAVGGTTLSTDAQGQWLAEQGWYDVPLTQGSGGGSSVLFARPSWQVGHEHAGPHDKRLVPDVVAEADWKRFWDAARRGLKQDPLVKLPERQQSGVARNLIC